MALLPALLLLNKRERKEERDSGNKLDVPNRQRQTRRGKKHITQPEQPTNNFDPVELSRRAVDGGNSDSDSDNNDNNNIIIILPFVNIVASPRLFPHHSTRHGVDQHASKLCPGPVQ